MYRSPSPQYYQPQQYYNQAYDLGYQARKKKIIDYTLPPDDQIIREPRKRQQQQPHPQQQYVQYRERSPQEPGYYIQQYPALKYDPQQYITRYAPSQYIEYIEPELQKQQRAYILPRMTRSKENYSHSVHSDNSDSMKIQNYQQALPQSHHHHPYYYQQQQQQYQPVYEKKIKRVKEYPATAEKIIREPRWKPEKMKAM